MRELEALEMIQMMLKFFLKVNGFYWCVVQKRDIQKRDATFKKGVK